MIPARPLFRALILSFTLLLAPALGGVAPASSQAASSQAARATTETESEYPWKLAEQQYGIDVYTRPVSGSGIMEFKAEAEINAPLDSIDTLLHDASLFKTWFPNTPKSKLLKREGEVSYQWSVLRTPWPISDRDNVLRAVTKKDREAGIVQISVVAAPDAHPEQEDYVRVREAHGKWILESIGERKTRVLFQMHLEPGGGIPQWLINASVVDTPLEAITNLREAVDADEFANTN